MDKDYLLRPFQVDGELKWLNIDKCEWDEVYNDEPYNPSLKEDNPKIIAIACHGGVEFPSFFVIPSNDISLIKINIYTEPGIVSTYDIIKESMTEFIRDIKREGNSKRLKSVYTSGQIIMDNNYSYDFQSNIKNFMFDDITNQDQANLRLWNTLFSAGNKYNHRLDGEGKLSLSTLVEVLSEEYPSVPLDIHIDSCSGVIYDIHCEHLKSPFQGKNLKHGEYHSIQINDQSYKTPFNPNDDDIVLFFVPSDDIKKFIRGNNNILALLEMDKDEIISPIKNFDRIKYSFLKNIYSDAEEDVLKKIVEMISIQYEVVPIEKNDIYKKVMGGYLKLYKNEIVKQLPKDGKPIIVKKSFPEEYNNKSVYMVAMRKEGTIQESRWSIRSETDVTDYRPVYEEMLKSSGKQWTLFKLINDIDMDNITTELKQVINGILEHLRQGKVIKFDENQLCDLIDLSQGKDHRFTFLSKMNNFGENIHSRDVLDWLLSKLIRKKI